MWRCYLQSWAYSLTELYKYLPFLPHIYQDVSSCRTPVFCHFSSLCFLWQESPSPHHVSSEILLTLQNRAFSVISSGTGSCASPRGLIPPSSVLLVLNMPPLLVLMAQRWNDLFLCLEIFSLYMSSNERHMIFRFAHLVLWNKKSGLQMSNHIVTHLMIYSYWKVHLHDTETAPYNMDYISLLITESVN